MQENKTPIDVNLKDGTVYSFDPNKGYILAFDSRSITQYDLDRLSAMMKEQGIDGIIVRVPDIHSSMIVLESEKKNGRRG